MKKYLSKKVVATSASGVGLLFGNFVSAAPIRAGDVVVYRVGNGAAALSSASTAVFLDEYTPTGTLVQSIAAPTAVAGNQAALTASGSATSEGEITLSPNGTYLALTGYNSAPGVASINGTASTSVARVVGLLNTGTGVIDTSTQLSDVSTGNNIRGAVTTDGNTIYTSGTATGTSSGVHYTTLGSTTSTQIVAGNQRSVTVFNNQLYVSSSSGTAPSSLGVSAVGTGTPTAAASETNIGVADTNPYAYQILKLGSAAGDTVYVADNTAGIQKYSLVNNAYTLTGTATLAGVLGLSAVTTGSSVALYATTGTGIYSLTDASGFDGTLTGTPTSIVTAGTNTAFRGIVATAATVATPEPASLALLGGSAITLLTRRRRIAR